MGQGRALVLCPSTSWCEFIHLVAAANTMFKCTAGPHHERQPQRKGVSHTPFSVDYIMANCKPCRQQQPADGTYTGAPDWINPDPLPIHMAILCNVAHICILCVPCSE